MDIHAATTSADDVLSTRVRQLTREDHSQAENSAFITELMSGKRSLRDYALLVCQYFYIYGALDTAVEACRESAGNEAFRALFDPNLDRRDALAADLESLLPLTDWDAPAAMTATTDYVARIVRVCDDPVRLAAHHYLRYLGDLSGGLAIASLVRRHYQARDDQLHMYTFAAIPKPKVYKDHYRANLDALKLDQQDREAFIDETRRGFQFNQAIFEDLFDYTQAHPVRHCAMEGR
ncbi:heme oxygenase (biliverdin-producing) [Auritidibacter sp. NML100628]|uniref:biliverdin-producing heme oxygenase n=1 Tax=Auritidibacter sp. NML100628 TaxID=2170742 RepID=UPI000D73E547|nr:biliverdin-producing heme oxygenase [Auritidibacter sp. NML100628]PXA76710.1 biliverdin-producing heme oxygenase [Auritidibacter sp. NML100628]